MSVIRHLFNTHNQTLVQQEDRPQIGFYSLKYTFRVQNSHLQQYYEISQYTHIWEIIYNIIYKHHIDHKKKVE